MVVMSGEVITDESADIGGTFPEAEALADFLEVVDVMIGPNELLLWVDLHHFCLQFFQGALESYPEVLYG